MCPTLCDPIDGSPPGSPSLGFFRQEHWSGCHFLLQCMNVKSESEVAQSCPTLVGPPHLRDPMGHSSDPMDFSLPGSSVHGTCQARVLEWGAIAFSRCTENAYPKHLCLKSPNCTILLFLLTECLSPWSLPLKHTSSPCTSSHHVN